MKCKQFEPEQLNDIHGNSYEPDPSETPARENGSSPGAWM